MSTLKAHFVNGQIVLDEPAEIAEGAPLIVLMSDEGAEMDDAERARVHRALDDADEDEAAGRIVSEDQVWAALRALK